MEAIEALHGGIPKTVEHNQVHLSRRLGMLNEHEWTGSSFGYKEWNEFTSVLRKGSTQNPECTFFSDLSSIDQQRLLEYKVVRGQKCLPSTFSDLIDDLELNSLSFKHDIVL